MRYLILFLIFLVLSVWVGVLLVEHSGFLLLVFKPWMIQMPLWFAALCFVFFVVIFYLIITTFNRLVFLRFRFNNWLKIRKEHKYYLKIQQAFLALIEAYFDKAEKLFNQSVKRAFDPPVISYLGAAFAAHEQKAFDKRDHYLKTADQLAPKASIAIGLIQAELQLKQGKFEQAEATLNRIKKTHPRHPRMLKLLEKTYIHMSDWQHLHLLLPSLRKARLITKNEYILFEKNIYCELFRAASTKRLTDLRLLWEEVPRYLKKNPEVVLAYVSQLSQHAPVTGSETTKEMEHLIRKILKNTWSPELVALYGSSSITQLNRQLVIVGAWLQMYGEKQELLFLLAKICTRLKLWGKAKDYFARCLSLGPYPKANLEYGRLLEQLNETNDAMQIYREGLRQITLEKTELRQNK